MIDFSVTIGGIFFLLILAMFPLTIFFRLLYELLYRPVLTFFERL